MQAEAEAKYARKKAIAYGGVPPTTVPPTATDETAMETPPNTKTAPVQPGDFLGGKPLCKGPDEATWFGGGKEKKRPNSIACLDAYMQDKGEEFHQFTGESREMSISDMDHFREWTLKLRRYLQTDKGLAESLKETSLLGLTQNFEGTPLRVLSDLAEWERTPEAKRIPFHLDDVPDNIISPSQMPPASPPWRTLPTTNYVKPLIDRTPGAHRNPMTRAINTRKQLKHMITVYHKGTAAPKPPMMGTLTDETKEEKKKEKKKQKKTEEKRKEEKKCTGIERQHEAAEEGEPNRAGDEWRVAAESAAQGLRVSRIDKLTVDETTGSWIVFL